MKEFLLLSVIRSALIALALMYITSCYLWLQLNFLPSLLEMSPADRGFVLMVWGFIAAGVQIIFLTYQQIVHENKRNWR